MKSQEKNNKEKNPDYHQAALERIGLNETSPFLYLLIVCSIWSKHMPNRNKSRETVLGVLHRLHMITRRLGIKCNDYNVTII